MSTGFLTVMRGDGVRRASELTRLREVFPECEDKVIELRARLAELDALSTNALILRLETRSARAWSDALAPEREA